MTDNIINFSDIVKAKNNEMLEEDFWKNLDDIINETYDFSIGQNKSIDVPWPTSMPDELEYILNNSPASRMATFLVGDLYSSGDDPSEKKLADDMVILTMLYETAILESKTESYEKSNGALNTLYKHFEEIRKSIKLEELL